MSIRHPTIQSMGTSEFRRRLAHWIGSVRYGDDVICIRRRGADPVYLISKADFDLMEQKRLDIDVGPWDEELKARSGGIMAWLRKRRG